MSDENEEVAVGESDGSASESEQVEEVQPAEPIVPPVPDETVESEG